MKLSNTLKIAFRSLGRNKLRSFLTMLGIIIGVAAVIAMLAVGQGARDSVQAQIASLGTNVLIIVPGAVNQGGVRMDVGTVNRLTEDDATVISQQCPAVANVTPVARTGAQIIEGSQNWHTVVYGGYSNYLDIRDWQILNGTMFSDADERSATKVCVIGNTIVTNLFGAGANPVGQVIRIKNLPFKIIGTLVPKGQNAYGQDQDDFILTPFSSAEKKLIGSIYVQMLLASATTAPEINEAKDEITQTLRSRHKLTPVEDNDFTIRTQTDIGNAADQTSQTMTILLASIASISLLVGGIGIMNIMLVSVTERTREIGIRLAVGARGTDVLLQFLIEALVVSFAGGIIGVVIGVVTSQTLSRVQGWAVAVSPQSIGLAFLSAAAIGIFFGWYPARKAANLNPIDALRYE
jgi:putative ABC transport system permease protein